jgi:NAD(P)-dependent dehydrogenase (short-subunit alcohol dehydrogenase family)
VKIEGARAVVTGGAHRLGRELVLGLARRGADVAFTYRSRPSDAESTLADARALGANAQAVQADVSQASEALRAVAACAEALGGLDVLVHAVSGGFVPRPPQDVDESLFDAAIDSTLKGGFFCAQGAYRAFDGHGVVIFLTDVAGIEPWPSFAPHGVAKAGLVHLTKTLARAWAPGVRVCGIAPGTVLMPDGASPESIRRSADATVLKRLGEPIDIVRTVEFVIESDYVTGSQIVVDGGRLLL